MAKEQTEDYCLILRVYRTILSYFRGLYKGNYQNIYKRDYLPEYKVKKRRTKKSFLAYGETKMKRNLKEEITARKEACERIANEYKEEWKKEKGTDTSSTVFRLYKDFLIQSQTYEKVIELILEEETKEKTKILLRWNSTGYDKIILNHASKQSNDNEEHFITGQNIGVLK